MTELTMKEKLALIWRHTHRDFKGKNAEGVKSILVLREGGTTLVPLTGLTPEEVERQMPFMLKQEAKRTAKKGAKAAEAAIQKAVTGFQIPMMSIPALYRLLETQIAAGAGEEKLKATVAEFPGVVAA